MKHHHNLTIPWYTRNGLVLAIILTLAAIIFTAVFMADYLYLDEAYQLWHRHDIRNYQMSSSDGRLLSGLFFQKTFSSISSVEQVRYLRIFSLGGWILTSWLLYFIAKQWVRQLELPSSIPFHCPIEIYIRLPRARGISGWTSLMAPSCLPQEVVPQEVVLPPILVDWCVVF